MNVNSKVMFKPKGDFFIQWSVLFDTSLQRRDAFQLLVVILSSFEAHFQVSQAQRLE